MPFSFISKKNSSNEISNCAFITHTSVFFPLSATVVNSWVMLGGKQEFAHHGNRQCVQKEGWQG